MWYTYCFYFLPTVNKHWKECLQPNRLKKKTFLYDHITTSDEALVQWFIEIWFPKIKKLHDEKWPPIEKSKGEGEHELRATMNRYVFKYTNIASLKSVEEGALALKWNDIFWEEVVKRHPEIFDEDKQIDKIVIEKKLEPKGEIILLPGVDNNANLRQIFQ